MAAKKNPTDQTSSKKFCLLLTFIYSVITLILVLPLLHIQAFQSSLSSIRWEQPPILNTNYTEIDSRKLQTMSSRLINSVTFLPLKDLRFEKTATEGHTWFMSSLKDTIEEDEAEYLYFPSEASNDRILCLRGRHYHDGSKNEYALAWRDHLPENSTLLPDLTYISNTYYDYENMWHGLSAMIPFVRWYEKRNCEVPARWVLFRCGEVRTRVGNWIGNLMEATFGERLKIEELQDGVVCFEKSVVFRHEMGKMEKKNRMRVFDLLRCKGRSFCNLSLLDSKEEFTESGVPLFVLTLFLRTGARSFKNESVVVGIFEEQCRKVEGCKFVVARSDNLSFCDQVKLMSSTDILVSPHGAQLTNMFFMDKESSVMEFYPRGWLEMMGPGQYVYLWLSQWSRMNHQGAWRDHQGPECPPGLEPEGYGPRSCFTFYKESQVGHNHTFFSEWAMEVANRMKKKKMDEAGKRHPQSPSSAPYVCPCSL